MRASWPTAGPVDETFLKEKLYIDEVSHDFRVRIKKMLELREKVHAHPRTTCNTCCGCGF